ncbi:MAG: hypothetical protein MJY52_02420 [Bacteroidaceae bacterium]|nr:hypothetical protein [Bacteroidaceae bacterium]
MNTYDYGARQYDPARITWDRMDQLCEKYYNINPYVYCAGDPVNRIDIHGDSISVEEKYRELFFNAIRAIFGENFTQKFGFNKNGKLTFIGNKQDIKALDKNAQKLFNGLNKIMKGEQTTNIIFENKSDRLDETGLLNHGGAATYRKDNSLEILINPKVAETFPVLECTSLFYKNQGKSNGTDLIYAEKFVNTNLADRLFHELGEVLYKGLPSNNVIDYNNYARKKLNLHKRNYDEQHNCYIIVEY